MIYKFCPDIHEDLQSSLLNDGSFMPMEVIKENDSAQDEDISFLLQDQLSILFSGSALDASVSLQKLTSIITENPKICFPFIKPDIVERVISLIHTECFSNSIHFLSIIFKLYPISNTKEFSKLSEDLYNNIAFHLKWEKINDTIIDIESILVHSITNSSSCQVFFHSKSMKEIERHIQNFIQNPIQNDLVLFSLKIMKLLTQFPQVPTEFSRMISYLIEISCICDDEPSCIALNILTNLVKNSEIPVFRNVIEYGAPETTFIEDLSSFLQVGVFHEKRIASFQFLSALSAYGDVILEKMICSSTLYESIKALEDKKDDIILEALNLFLSWSVNSEKCNKFNFCNSHLYDKICCVNFAHLLKNCSFEVKDSLVNLIMFLSQSACPSQLVSLLNQDFFVLIVDQLDDINYQFSFSILKALQSVVIKCQEYPDFIQMIAFELADQVVFHNMTLDAELKILLGSIDNLTKELDDTS